MKLLTVLFVVAQQEAGALRTATKKNSVSEATTQLMMQSKVEKLVPVDEHHLKINSISSEQTGSRNLQGTDDQYYNEDYICSDTYLWTDVECPAGFTYDYDRFGTFYDATYTLLYGCCSVDVDNCCVNANGDDQINDDDTPDTAPVAAPTQNNDDGVDNPSAPSPDPEGCTVCQEMLIMSKELIKCESGYVVDDDKIANYIDIDGNCLPNSCCLTNINKSCCKLEKSTEIDVDNPSAPSPDPEGCTVCQEMLIVSKELLQCESGYVIDDEKIANYIDVDGVCLPNSCCLSDINKSCCKPEKSTEIAAIVIIVIAVIVGIFAVVGFCHCMTKKKKESKTQQIIVVQQPGAMDNKTTNHNTVSVHEKVAMGTMLTPTTTEHSSYPTPLPPPSTTVEPTIYVTTDTGNIPVASNVQVYTP